MAADRMEGCRKGDGHAYDDRRTGSNNAGLLSHRCDQDNEELGDGDGKVDHGRPIIARGAIAGGPGEDFCPTAIQSILGSSANRRRTPNRRECGAYSDEGPSCEYSAFLDQ